jgi:hypothetical protein
MAYAPISSNAVVFICATATSPLSFAIPQELLNLSPMDVRPDDAIQAYLKTGEHDPMFFAWPGNGVLDKSRIGTANLRDALIAEVLRRTENQQGLAIPDGMDLHQFSRQKFCAMVKGLFPRSEQEIVLSMLERSVVFLTQENIVSVLRDMTWLGTAWDLANLYLASCSVELLAEDAPQLLGLGIGTTCYVSTDYFHTKNHFEDYVLHEAAHVFHNCKRETLGLPSSRRREWLLEIEFRKRETFAYACEAYSRILELGVDQKHRQKLLAELALKPLPGDDRVDGEEYLDILGEAVAVRNGWKRILSRCSTDIDESVQ